MKWTMTLEISSIKQMLMLKSLLLLTYAFSRLALSMWARKLTTTLASLPWRKSESSAITRSQDLRHIWRQVAVCASSWKHLRAWTTTSDRSKRTKYSQTGPRSSSIWTQTKVKSKSSDCLTWGNSVSCIASFVISRHYSLTCAKQSLDTRLPHRLMVVCSLMQTWKALESKQASSSPSSALPTSRWLTLLCKNRSLSNSSNSNLW